MVLFLSYLVRDSWYSIRENVYVYSISGVVYGRWDVRFKFKCIQGFEVCIEPAIENSCASRFLNIRFSPLDSNLTCLRPQRKLFPYQLECFVAVMSINRSMMLLFSACYIDLMNINLKAKPQTLRSALIFFLHRCAMCSLAYYQIQLCMFLLKFRPSYHKLRCVFTWLEGWISNHKLHNFEMIICRGEYVRYR